MVSRRIEEYGLRPVPGDLVLKGGMAGNTAVVQLTRTWILYHSVFKSSKVLVKKEMHSNWETERLHEARLLVCITSEKICMCFEKAAKSGPPA